MWTAPLMKILSLGVNTEKPPLFETKIGTLVTLMDFRWGMLQREVEVETISISRINTES